MRLRNWAIAALYDKVMRRAEEKSLGPWRRELLSLSSGRVLEVGVGTGVNLDHYPDSITELVLTEPDHSMLNRLQKKMASHTSPGRVVCTAAEALPFPDEHFDTAVTTLVLCSVQNPAKCLSELHRVLKPGGMLILIEHVCATDNLRLLRWQKRCEPVWKRVAGNCHLSRDTLSLLRVAGFDCRNIRHDTMHGALAIASPVIRGIAEKT